MKRMYWGCLGSGCVGSLAVGLFIVLAPFTFVAWLNALSAAIEAVDWFEVGVAMRQIVEVIVQLL